MIEDKKADQYRVESEANEATIETKNGWEGTAKRCETLSVRKCARTNLKLVPKRLEEAIHDAFDRLDKNRLAGRANLKLESREHDHNEE